MIGVFYGLIGMLSIFIGLIIMVLFGLNIYGIVLSGQAINNLVCSEQLKVFFIGSIVVLGCLILGLGTYCVIITNSNSNSNSDSDTTEKKMVISLYGIIFLIFTLVWACLGVGWIQNAVSCNTDIIRSANIVLTILFVHSGIVIGIFSILFACFLFDIIKGCCQIRV